jgi:uncharacterized protein (DUF983 family)
MTEPQHPAISPVKAALACRCPRCGNGPLFTQLLTLREKCSSCGLDYKFIDTGDGPAVFAIFILGFLMLGGAMIAHFSYGMPLWLVYTSFAVLTPLVAIGLLRYLKALLIALQYKHRAEEGRLAKD